MATQFSNLLDSYSVRPSWQVAGVDYAVGIPDSITLKDPNTMVMTGVSVDKNAHIVFVNGNNVTLDGWNFTGWQVIVTGANTTVTDSDFTRGVLKYDIGSVNGTVTHNLFDQAGTTPNTAPFMVFGAGTFTVTNNYFKDSYHMHAQFTYGNGGQNQTVIFDYNLLQNAGEGAPNGAHGDWVQAFGVNLLNSHFDFNTVIQDKAGAATQGWSLQGSADSAYLHGDTTINNNTMIVKTNTNYAVLLEQHRIDGTVTVDNNFIDMTGVGGAFDTINTAPGPYPGHVVEANDFNMVTHTYIYPPDGGPPPPPPPPPPQGDNLVVNGGFETHDFSGWTLSGATGTSPFGPQSLIDANAHSGSFGANFGPVGSDGMMAQNVNVTAGQHYTLDYWLWNGGGTPSDFAVKWDGHIVTSFVNSPAQGYTHYSFDVVGDTDGVSNLEFDFRQDPTHWSIDDIALHLVGGSTPPPDTTPPPAPVVASFSDDTGTLGDGITSDHTLLLSGTAEASSIVKLFDGGASLGQVTAGTGGAWSFTTGTLTESAHSFTATATDAAGNVSPMSATLAVTVEAVPPPPPDEFVLIQGTSKNNVLTGTSEIDHIFGMGGNDVLTGLGSADQLTGGTGNDRFDFNALADSAPGAADTIMDFVHASDVIDLRTIDANTSVANNQAFAFGGQNNGVVVHGVTWHEANGETVVTANVTGGTQVDFELHLAGTNLHLTQQDFLL